MATAAKILGVAPASLSKVCGVAKANISKVMGVAMPASDTLLDSYSEAYQDTYMDLTSTKWVGHCLTLAAAKTITRVKVYLAKSGSSPTGNVTAHIYGVTGSVGTTATGTGSSLADSSTTVAVSSLSTSPALVEFDFNYAASGNIDLVFKATGVGCNIYLDQSSPSHAGNACLYSVGNWYTQSAIWGTADMIFYLYGT